MTRSIMSLALTASLATTGQGFQPAVGAGCPASSTGTAGFATTGSGSFFAVGGQPVSRECSS